MSDIDGLLTAILEKPQETAPRLVLADWLEEQGDVSNNARAELIRLQIQWETGDPEEHPALHRRACEILKEFANLAEILQPLLRRKVAMLSLGGALAMALTESAMSVVDGPLQSGSVWGGHLLQCTDTFPTTLTIRRRNTNRIEGDMQQDFSSVLGPGTHGRFFFRGVVAGRSRLMFVTYRVEQPAAWPGLYQLELKPGSWLNGTWWLPAEQRRGEMRLRRRREE